MNMDTALPFSTMDHVALTVFHPRRSRTEFFNDKINISYITKLLLLLMRDLHLNILLLRAADLATRDRPARDARQMRVLPQYARAAATAHARVTVVLHRVVALLVPCSQSQLQQARSGGCKPVSAVVSPLRRLVKARFGGCKASVKHLASHTQPKTRGASFAEGRCPQRLSLPPQWRGSVDQSRRGGRVRWVGASSARPKSNRHLREEGRGVNRLVRPRAMVVTSGKPDGQAPRRPSPAGAGNRKKVNA